MNRTDLIARLIALPAEINTAEEALLLTEARRQAAADALQQVEDELLLTGVEGKNAEQRAAAIRTETGGQRERLAACEYEVSLSKIVLRRLTTELSAFKSVARLLAGGDR